MLAVVALAIYAVTAVSALADATNSGLSAGRRNVSWGALVLSFLLVAVAAWISFNQRDDPGVGVPLFLAGLAGWFILASSAAIG